METHQNPSLILASLALFSFSVLAHAQMGQLPSDLGSTCTSTQINASKVREGLRNERVPNVCRDEAAKQYEACRLPAEGDLDMKATTGFSTIRNGALAQRDGLHQAASANTRKAMGCHEASRRVDEVCGQIAEDVRTAMENNSRSERQEVERLPPGQSRPSLESEIHRRYGEVSRQLQDQRQAISEFRAAALKALKDNARCYADMARRDTFDADRANTVLASANSDSPLPEAIQPTEVANLKTTEPSPQQGGVVQGVRGQAQAEAQKTVLRQAVTPLVEEASLLARGAKVVAGAPAGPVGLTTVSLGILLGSENPAGHACDMVYIDALAADAAGCRVATRNVIQSLAVDP